MSLELINVWYIVAAALFVYGLKQLGSPRTAGYWIPRRRISRTAARSSRSRSATRSAAPRRSARLPRAAEQA